MLLSEIARHLGGRLEGPDLEVVQLSPPGGAGLVVVREAKFLAEALEKAVALVLPESLEFSGGVSRVRVADIRSAWPTVLQLFEPPEPTIPGIHPTAVVDASAHIDPTASIGPFVVVGGGVKVAAGARVGAFCYLGQSVEIGPNTTLEPRVTLHPRTQIGRDCYIGSGAVLGSLGFGFQDGQRLAHTGRVVVGQGVELGVGSVVQRSVVGETHIGDHSKLGDLVNIGHNVQLGQGVVMVGPAAIGGSSVIEDSVVMGGWVVISDHVRVGRGAKILGGSGISKEVPAGQTWASGIPARAAREHWRRLGILDWLVVVERKLRALLGQPHA